MNFFITNREIIKKPNGTEAVREDGGEHAGDNLRFGKYENKTFKLFKEPVTDAEMAYGNTGDASLRELKGSARFFREIYDQLCDKEEKNDVLFFIHGFNTDLDGVREAFDHLNKKYVDNPASPIAHVIIFTWPGKSPKIPLHYFDDKKDAIRSGEALARGMEKLIRFFREFLFNAKNVPCNRTIHFMAHSMGHRVLKHMMLELHNKNIALPDLFGEILLMAADIEYDIFETTEAFSKLIELGKRVHVYFHHFDGVLDISKYTKNFSNRLGRYGRKRIDSAQVDVIDANISNTKDDSNVSLEEKLFNHWYYYTSTPVIDDVINVINGNESKFITAF